MKDTMHFVRNFEADISKLRNYEMEHHQSAVGEQLSRWLFS